MDNNYSINMVNSVDFVNLLKKHSAEKIAFRSTDARMYNGHMYGDFCDYTAPITIGEIRYDVRFVCAGPIPEGWAFEKDTGNIIRTDGSKVDFVRTLIKIGVSPATLEKLKKMKATELREILDESPLEDDDISQIAYRLEKRGDKHTFETDNPNWDKVQVKVGKKDSYHNTLSFISEIPWVKHINAATDEIGNLLDEAGFEVYDVR